MKITLISSVVALAFGTTLSVAQAATESRETTIEKSTTVEAPVVANPRIEETTTTKSKKGIFGRKKSETTSSTVTYGQEPKSSTSREYKSRTTVESERSY